jgi:GDPmannose 4,6-dehydratase
MVRIVRQTSLRGVDDTAREYRDYVLGTGRLHHVWELIDRAFALAGFTLRWHLDCADPLSWHATFESSDAPAVVVGPELVRPADPAAIAADPRRARAELGWTPRPDLDVFLADMLDALSPREAEAVSPAPS